MMAAASAVATFPATTMGTFAASVATTAACMEAAATLMSDDCATAPVVELGVVAATARMVFPRMVNVEDRIIARRPTHHTSMARSHSRDNQRSHSRGRIRWRRMRSCREVSALRSIGPIANIGVRAFQGTPHAGLPSSL